MTSRFFRRDGRFFVNSDGRNGQMADFPVAYTIGVFPLQQYLVEYPDGRLQTLWIAWDAGSREAGGQRWFHLYPDQPVRHGDILHWTELNQNWNFMCAECHTTDLRKNDDAASEHFRTTWSELCRWAVRSRSPPIMSSADSVGELVVLVMRQAALQ